jgi:hypothetical protein
MVEQTSVDVVFPYALYNNNTPNDYIDSLQNSTFDKLPRPTVSVPIVVLNDGQIQSIDDVEAQVVAIGELEYDENGISPTPVNRMKAARAAYNALEPIIRQAVSNYEILLAAEQRHQLLLLAAQGKLPASEVLNDPQRLLCETDTGISLISDKDLLADAITFNLADLKAFEANGDIKLVFTVTPLDGIPDAETFLAESALQANNLKSTGYVLDIKLTLQVGTHEPRALSELLHEQILEIDIPSQYREAGALYYALNLHGSGVYISKDQNVEDEATLKISTGKFSTYILAYAWLPTDPGGETPTPTTPDDGSTPAAPLPSSPGSGGRTPTDDTLRTANVTPDATGIVDTTAYAEDYLTADALNSLAQQTPSASAIQEVTQDEAPLASGLLQTAGQNLQTILWTSVLLVAALALWFILYLVRKNKKNRKMTE